jgi:hypothetical protein
LINIIYSVSIPWKNGKPSGFPSGWDRKYGAEQLAEKLDAHKYRALSDCLFVNSDVSLSERILDIRAEE